MNIKISCINNISDTNIKTHVTILYFYGNHWIYVGVLILVHNNTRNKYLFICTWEKLFIKNSIKTIIFFIFKVIKDRFSFINKLLIFYFLLEL